MKILLFMPLLQAFLISFSRMTLVYKKSISFHVYGRNLLRALMFCTCLHAASNLILLQPVAQMGFLFLITTLCSLYDAIDASFYYYFGSGFLKVLPHLPKGSQRKSNLLNSVIAYANQFFLVKYFGSVAIVYTAGVAISKWYLAPSLAYAEFMLICMVVVSVAQILLKPKQAKEVSGLENLFLSERDENPQAKPIYASSRKSNISLKESPGEVLPETIVLIINESAGADLRSSTSPELKLSEKNL